MSIANIDQEDLTRVLDGLVGCETSSKLVEPRKQIDDPNVLATYNDIEGQVRFVIITELQLANSLGAALTMIPPSAAEEASEAGTIPDNILENLYEVLNICSSIFQQYDNCRIVIDQLTIPGQSLPEGLSEKLKSAKCLLQTQFEIERYQSGLISLHQII